MTWQGQECYWVSQKRSPRRAKSPGPPSTTHACTPAGTHPQADLSPARDQVPLRADERKGSWNPTHWGGGEWGRARCRVLVPGRSHRPRGFKQCITHHPKEALHGANPPACLEWPLRHPVHPSRRRDFRLRSLTYCSDFLPDFLGGWGKLGLGVWRWRVGGTLVNAQSGLNLIGGSMPLSRRLLTTVRDCAPYVNLNFYAYLTPHRPGGLPFEPWGTGRFEVEIAAEGWELDKVLKMTA